MHRRSLLAGLGTLLAVGPLSGCAGSAPAGPTETGSPTRRSPDPSTDSPEESPTARPTPTASFEVHERSCGVGEHRASVSFTAAGVAIEGTIRGSDTCDTAALAGVRADGESLAVRVTTTRERTTETPACAQCITDISYAVTVDAHGARPERVVVRHDGETVTRATRS